MDILEMIGLFAVVFAVSLAVSYLITSSRGKKLEQVHLPVNTKVRMVGAGGAYRCYFLRWEKEGIVFSTPLQRDRYVPLRVGESLIVQAPGASSLVTFCSEVISRSQETHELVLSHPRLVRKVDRRSEPRDTTCKGTIALINGLEGSLVDLSAGGLKAVVKGGIKPGDDVTIKLPRGMGVVDGWTLESAPAALDGGLGREVRIQFQKPLAGLGLTSQLV
jgi:hypothetical protein